MPRSPRPLMLALAAGGSALALATGLTMAATVSASAHTLHVDQGIGSSTGSDDSGGGLLSGGTRLVPRSTEVLSGGTGALPGGTGVLDDVTGLVGQVTAPLTGAVGGAGGSSGSTGSAPSLPAPDLSAPSLPVPSLPGSGSPSESPLAPVGSGLKSVLDKAKESVADTPLAPVVPGSAPRDGLDLTVKAAPLATACAQATGDGTALANLSVNVGGHDVSAPLVEALPGLLAPCPAGSGDKATDGPGGVLDGSLSDLVGACVHVTPKAPLNASIMLLDTELIGTLTKAGVPLDQLVVPCPPGTPGVDQGGDGGKRGGTGADQGGGKGGGKDDTTGAAPGSVGGKAGAGAGGGGASSDGNCDPNLDAQLSAGILPSSAPQLLPWLLLGLVLIGRRRLGRMVSALRPGDSTS